MRKVTVTEKYRAVNEGQMSKKEFVRQMRQQFPQHITQFNGYDDSVQILKNRGLLFEAAKTEKAFSGVKVYDDRPALTYSLDALDRGIRAELAALGVTMPHQGVNPEDYLKAEKKAKDNLEKNPTHYLDLMAGESNKVDKHDQEKEVKRGAADKDTFNDMKKATLKENISEDEEEDAKNDLDSYDHDFPHQDESMSEDAKKALLGQVVGALRAKYPDITASIVKDFIKTHYQDLLDGADIETEFGEYIQHNYDLMEKQGKDHDGDGDVDSDDYLAARDKAIKKAMGKDVDENQGDYVSFAMQNIGDENTPVHLTHGFDRYDEKKYKTTLGKAIAFIQKNAEKAAIDNNDVTVDGGPGVARITIGDQEFDIEAITKDESYAMKRMQKAHTQDRLAGKKSTYDKAKEKEDKQKEQLKEAIKTIIKKSLVNEAATVKLSDWAEGYESFPGVKSVVNELENIVTEIESFYDKMSDKIAKTFEKTSGFENEEGLKIGGFIAPSLESAFRQDLSKVIKKGTFFNKIELPKVRTITQADVDAHNSGERPLGEDEKQTIYTPNF